MPYVLIAVVLLIAVLVIYISMRPPAFHVERSAQINAPAATVFPMINDFHQWVKWSPFEKLDANMKKTFEGPSAGPGSVYGWSGNAKAGAGRITILDSRPNELATMKLEMFKPFKATNHVTFKLVPTNAGTQVSWIMDGKNNFMSKAFQMFMNMDTLIGKDFEEGLANLDRVARS